LRRRKWFHKRKVREYWAERLVKLGKFDSIFEVMEADYCFACGFTATVKNGDDFNTKFKTYGTEKAHIKAIVGGGPDEIENIHCLCSTCHTDSEYLSGDQYWIWFKSRTFWDRTYSVFLKHDSLHKHLQPIFNREK
tara:strand:- start:451 stop:858 length:408 start_codon:yes stop_codon:yes gene_type:complete